MREKTKTIACFFASLLIASCASDVIVSANNGLDEKMAQKNNHIDYVEFAAEDLPAIKTFYQNTFGWEFQDWGPDYASFSSAGLHGGIRGAEKPVDGSSLIILYADDLTLSEKNVVANGGDIIERHEFPGGRRFHFRDPAGNILGVWTMVEEEEATSP